MNKTALRTIQNKKYPVYYQFIDNGSEDTIVFLHGLFSTSSIFKYITKLIKKNIILIELRGIAYSKTKSPFIDNYVEDIKLVLDKENIKKVTIVGYSLGCSIANKFAEEWSNMVEKIIMLAPINKTLKEIGKNNFVSTLMEELGKGFFKKWRGFLNKEKKRASWWQFGISGLFNFKLLKESYKQIRITSKCKVVILNGKKDAFFNFKDNQLKLPNIIHKQIDNLDHFLFFQKSKVEILTKYLMPHLQEAKAKT